MINDPTFAVDKDVVSIIKDDSEPDFPKLTTEAQILLKEASFDQDGTVHCYGTMDGFTIGTNRKDFIEDQNPRSVAKWKSAMKQLIDECLLDEIGHKGEVFQINELGYQNADRIKI